MSIKKKLLFCSAEGLGNIVQLIPVIRTLNEVLGFEIDLWLAFGSFAIPKVIPWADKWIVGAEINNIDFPQYEGVVATIWVKNHIKNIPLKLLNRIVPLSMDRSEVGTYLDIARDLGVPEDKLIWHGECTRLNFTCLDSRYDIVINNGYNKYGSANWQIKSYPYYDIVAKKLKDEGLRVCSVGTVGEHVENTEDRTGMSLLESISLIASSRLLLCNDSGLYHVSNALSVPNIVIFTATSTKKNFDGRFHKFAHIICRDDLECRSCQSTKRWNKDCKTWDCREIDPNVIVEKVMEILNGK